MKKMLSIEYSAAELEIVSRYVEEMKDNKSIQNINEMIQQATQNENFDADAIDKSIEIVKRMFKSYNSNAENSEYLFSQDNDENTNKIKMYFFLIIYKLYVYLNSYVENTDTDKNNLFKKNLSFAIRHSNYFLYLEIKNKLRKIFASQFEGKDDTYINDKIADIINKIVKNIGTDKVTHNLIYSFKYIRDKRRELFKSIEENPEEKEEHLGDPVLSISSYFAHFEQPQKQEQEEEEEEEQEEEQEEVIENRDWLVLNNIDEKSTKFELNNDTIIIEFRDFPNFCYLNLFITSNEELRKEILKNNIGTLNMKIVDDYMKSNNIK
jgi:hypothetical protein